MREESPRVTQEQLDMMRHTIGIRDAKKPYRNYYNASEGCDGFQNLVDLVEMGLMERYKSSVSSDTCFFLTVAGHKMLGVIK